MVNKIQTVAGNTGYRHQLDRARRFLERVQRPVFEDMEIQVDDVEFQDMMWSFFQNCWHVKDWVCNDPLVPSATKGAVVDMAHHLSPDLKMCQELCNGTKHLGMRPGAKHKSTDTTYDFARGHVEMDCVIDDGNGNEISGKELARRCIAEWERILGLQGLNTTRPPDPLPPVLRG